MTKKNSAPIGKGKVKKNPKTISPKHKIPLATKKKNPGTQLITIQDALAFFANQGVPITENTANELAELAKIRTTYQGSAHDTTRHLKILMLQALEKTLGIVASAAKMTGIHRATHYTWMEADEEYSECVKALGDVALDFAEEHLHGLIKEKNPAATIFYLKTKGKKRGYIETVHNMNQNFDDNNVHFYVPDNTRDGLVQDAEVVK